MSSPNDIEILIHYHCCCAPHPRFDAPAVIETVRRYLADGIIRPSNRGAEYETTPKGAAWLEAVCRTPYPRQVWLDAHGNTLLDGRDA